MNVHVCVFVYIFHVYVCVLVCIFKSLCVREFVIIFYVQFTTSSQRLDGGAYCGASVGGK